MPGMEDSIMAAFAGKPAGQAPAAAPKAEDKPADEKPAEGKPAGQAPLDEDGKPLPGPGEMMAGEVGEDGKRRIHSFGDEFKAKYGPRRPRD